MMATLDLAGIITRVCTDLKAKFAAASHTHALSDVTSLQTSLDGKQATLVSGTNIKTVNNESLLGSGNISISGGGSTSTWYGTSDTSSGTGTKVVTCAGFTLSTGAVISVLFSAANLIASPLLNVNSTGAKEIYVGTVRANSTTNVLRWSSGTLLTFVYDGAYWRFISAVADASIAPPRGAATWYGVCGTLATTAAKTTTIDNFVLMKSAIVTIQAETAQTYVGGALTLNVNNTGAKTVYKGNAATSSTNTLTWAAGDVLAFVYSWPGVGYWRYIGGSSTDSPSLPSVTSTDNGKVLQVVDGVWAAASLPSASGVSF